MLAQQATLLRDFLLPRIQQENRSTRRVLEAVPETQRDYRPHAESRSALELAWHIASSEIWLLEGVLHGQFAPEQPRMPAHIRSIGGVCSWHDRNMPDLIGEVAKLAGEPLAQRVEHGISDCPAVEYLYLLLMHSAHHRGQLSTYLRAMGAKVPAIYGDSADEPFCAPA